MKEFEITFDHANESVLNAIIINGRTLDKHQNNVNSANLEPRVHALADIVDPFSLANFTRELCTRKEFTESERVVTLLSMGGNKYKENPDVRERTDMQVVLSGLAGEVGSTSELAEQMLSEVIETEEDRYGFNLYALGIILGACLEVA